MNKQTEAMKLARLVINSLIASSHVCDPAAKHNIKEKNT